MDSDEGTPRPSVQPVAGQPNAKPTLFERIIEKTAKILRQSR